MKIAQYTLLLTAIATHNVVFAQPETDIIKEPFSVMYVSGEGDSKAVAKAKAEQKFLQEFALTLPKFVRSQERITNGEYSQRIDLVTASQIKILEPKYEFSYENNQFAVSLSAVAYVNLEELHHINEEIYRNKELSNKVKDLQSKYDLVLARMNQFEKKEGHHQALLKMNQSINDQLNELALDSTSRPLSVSQAGGQWSESDELIKALEAEEEQDRKKLREDRALKNKNQEIAITKQLATEFIDWYNAEHTFLTKKIISSNKRFEDKVTLINSHHKTMDGRVKVVASLEVNPQLLSDNELVTYKQSFRDFFNDILRHRYQTPVDDFSTLNKDVEQVIRRSTLAVGHGHFIPYLNDISDTRDKCLLKFSVYSEGPYLTESIYAEVEKKNKKTNRGWMPCELPEQLGNKVEYLVTFNGETKTITKDFYSLNPLAPYQYGTATFEVESYKELVKISPPTIKL